ncbi:MAG: peptidoglycan-binding protein [Candidatus Faecousia sp.]|nr:peptidoglycan-binding protein [Clostridiales bacterium]MDY6181142.1 peptidoglycan-binding protein [Candidatus Faecousia sp.]
MPPVTPYVPQRITVHLGAPGADAQNVTVSFIDYVKNVASSEIYPTWEESALRANILAIVSFALNRVYTEFYRSRGYDFDITSSTAYDQFFVNGRSYFTNVARLVDDLFNDYLRRPGFVEPLAAKFCNGTTVTCEGLSQWGSQNLAKQGYNSTQILRSYYGDVEIVTDAPIRGITSSYPGIALRRGFSGPSVVVVQASLNRISQNYPAIPKISPVDGIFGAQTEAAVRRFQEVFGLEPDGVVGKATWYALVRIYTAVTSLSELRSQGQRFYSISWATTNPISRGDTGVKVEHLQYMLSVLSAYIPEIPPLTVDGIFGSATENAVLAAQRRFGLPQTGVVNAETWDEIYDQFSGIETISWRNPESFPFTSALVGGNNPRNRYSRTSTMTQFPGNNLSMGNQDPVSQEAVR